VGTVFIMVYYYVMISEISPANVVTGTVGKIGVGTVVTQWTHEPLHSKQKINLLIIKKQLRDIDRTITGQSANAFGSRSSNRVPFEHCPCLTAGIKLRLYLINHAKWQSLQSIGSMVRNENSE